MAKKKTEQKEIKVELSSLKDCEDLYKKEKTSSFPFFIRECPLFLVQRALEEKVQVVFYENNLNTLFPTVASGEFKFPFKSYEDETHFSATSLFDKYDHLSLSFSSAAKVGIFGGLLYFIKAFKLFDIDLAKVKKGHPILNNAHFVEKEKCLTKLKEIQKNFNDLCMNPKINAEKRFLKILTLRQGDSFINVVPLHTQTAEKINEEIQTFFENKIFYPVKTKTMFGMCSNIQIFSYHIKRFNRVFASKELKFLKSFEELFLESVIGLDKKLQQNSIEECLPLIIKIEEKFYSEYFYKRMENFILKNTSLEICEIYLRRLGW